MLRQRIYNFFILQKNWFELFMSYGYKAMQISNVHLKPTVCNLVNNYKNISRA